MLNYEIKKNLEYNSNEVYFQGIPAAEIRQALKELKMRWNGFKKCWYGFADAEQIAEALKGGKVEHKLPKISHTPTKEEKAELLKEWRLIWGSREDMAEYCTNKTAKILKLNNRLVTFEKERLEKHFCYGFGYCGVTSEEDQRRATNNARTTKTDGGQTFINKNLAGLNENIETIKNIQAVRAGNDPEYNNRYFYHDTECYILKENYYNEDPAHNLYKVCFIKSYDFENNFRYKDVIGQKATDEELKQILAVYEEMKAEKMKRCETYLKKYGTEKLHVWTYLVD